VSAIAGIDFSTRFVDVVLLDEDTDHADWHRYPLAGLGDAFDRTRTVRYALPSRSWWDDVIAIGIEQPFGRGSSVTPLYRVQGAILACLPPLTLVQPWIPSSWRSAVGLAGNCSKDDVAAYVHDNCLEAIDWPQDACDALCIALATREALERTQDAA
jgi:hypothetical protein